MRQFCQSKLTLILGITILTILLSTSGYSWSIHPLLMRPGLSEVPEVKNAKPAQVRSLKAFLMTVEKDLETVLKDDETWLQQNMAWYQPLPESLSFKATGDRNTIVNRFLRATRINPKIKTELYLQRFPGETTKPSSRIPIEKITFLHDIEFWYATTFIKLKEGQTVSALDIVSTASDEPDFGIDIQLYANNESAHGKEYGFGTQPFGNPRLEYGSQAPLHMGFYHESSIVFMAAGVLKQTYPEYRIHQFHTLAKLAFAKGEDYWGWRFLGWGLHYLIDLMQPYHSAVLPGSSTANMLWINTKAMMGYPEDSEHALQLVSNRHGVFERYQQEVILAALKAGNQNHPVLKTLRQSGDVPVYHPLFPRDVVAKEANELADAVDEYMVQWAPTQFVDDPTFEFGNFKEQRKIVDIIRSKKGDQAIDAMNKVLSRTLENLSTYSRSYTRSALGQ